MASKSKRTYTRLMEEMKSEKNELKDSAFFKRPEPTSEDKVLVRMDNILEELKEIKSLLSEK